MEINKRAVQTETFIVIDQIITLHFHLSFSENPTEGIIFKDDTDKHTIMVAVTFYLALLSVIALVGYLKFFFRIR